MGLSTTTPLSLFLQAGMWMWCWASLDCVNKVNSLGLPDKQSGRSLDSPHWHTAVPALSAYPEWSATGRTPSERRWGVICSQASTALIGDSGICSIWIRNRSSKCNLTLATHLCNCYEEYLSRRPFREQVQRRRSDFLSIGQTGTLTVLANHLLKEYEVRCKPRELVRSYSWCGGGIKKH